MHKRGEVEPDEGGFGSGAARPDVPGARLGLIVVNYSSSGLLERHLVGLSQQAQGVVVVVVDNFSSLQE